MYLLNAFSLQMIHDFPCSISIREIEVLPEGLESAVGHSDTARILGVAMNRINVVLNRGDTAYVAQLQSGRLPEGCTSLPEGCTFKFFEIKIS